MIANSRGLEARNGLLYDLSKDDKMYLAVKEIVHNIVNKTIEIDEKERRKLYRYRKAILALHKNRNKKNNKKLLAQSGGYLPIILPLVTAALSLID